MKCRMTVAILIALFWTSVSAQDQLGVGAILGEPTGFSVKYWLDDKHAIDGAAAWSFWDGDGFQLHADYLWHNFEWLQAAATSGKLPVYFGVGGRLKLRDYDDRHDSKRDTVLGIRAPLGVSYLFNGQPFDVFAEIAPLMDLTPDVELNFSVAVGMRFYVK